MMEKLIDNFLEYLEIEKNCSKLTIRNYRHYLEKFYQWLKKIYGSIRIEKINLEMVRKYRVYLTRKTDKAGLPLSRATQSYYIIALRSFLRWLIKNDYKTLSPEKIELPKAKSRSLKFLDRKQIERLLAQPEVNKKDGLRDKAILEVLFSTGLRVSELVKVDRERINFERREFGVIGKGGQPRAVFLSERAVYWLKKYTASREDVWKPLFIRYSGKITDSPTGEEMRLSSRSVQRLVEKYCCKAHLAIKITPHGIRHSYATDLLMAGADLRSVQELLGHKNVATTQIYTHVTDKKLREIHEKYHGKS